MFGLEGNKSVLTEGSYHSSCYVGYWERGFPWPHTGKLRVAVPDVPAAPNLLSMSVGLELGDSRTHPCAEGHI